MFYYLLPIQRRVFVLGHLSSILVTTITHCSHFVQWNRSHSSSCFLEFFMQCRLHFLSRIWNCSVIEIFGVVCSKSKCSYYSNKFNQLHSTLLFYEIFYIIWVNKTLNISKCKIFLYRLFCKTVLAKVQNFKAHLTFFCWLEK